MTLTAKDVAEITRLLEDSTFDEMSLELDGLKLTVRRRGAAAPGISRKPEAEAAAVPEPQPPPSPQSDTASQSITAPLLGTFYRAPKPGAPPFVEIGSRVERETIIGIIEVMKLMNAVRAGTCGRVVDILAQDGALVEYGETLMRVTQESQA